MINYKANTLSVPIFMYFLFLSGFLTAQIIPYDSELIEEKYEDYIAERRQKEEASFRDKETTLLADEYFENFTGLNYYPVDLKYRIVGKLTRLPQSKKVNLDLTNGTPYGFLHYGKISFFMEGEAIELIVFEFPSHPGSGPTAIFVPFTDMTTGEENFGGGRFMIIKIPKGDQIVVDFNLAINPICVYDPDHACPVSPGSNFIGKRITAGAAMYYDPASTKTNSRY
jgi:uncharacterized protein (DUF1684 family)